MATENDTQMWASFGGTVETVKSRKMFVAPGGKRLRSWKEAEKLMKADAENKPGNFWILSSAISLPLHNGWGIQEYLQACGVCANSGLPVHTATRRA
jgi:hypothetical protein